MILCEHRDEAGESLEESRLIDTGMRKMHWCSWCGATWFTTSKRTKYFETYSDIGRRHNYMQMVGMLVGMAFIGLTAGPAFALVGLAPFIGFGLANVHNAYKEYRISNRMIRAIND